MNERLQRILRAGSRISGRLYLGIGGAVALTMAASLVAWYSFDRVGDAQRLVNERSVPEMAAAFRVARQSSALVAAAPRLTSAATREDFARVRDEIAAERTAFRERLEALTHRGESDGRLRRIRSRGGTLIANIKAIEASVAERFELIEQSDALRAELMALQNHLERILVRAIDDQFFFAITGYRTLGEPPVPRRNHFSEDEFHRYRHLVELQTTATLGTRLLGSAFALSDARLLEPLRERFEASAASAERNLAGLGDAAVVPELESDLAQLFDLGIGAKAGFDLRSRELALARRQQELLDRNRDLAAGLVTEVEGMVRTARASALDATQAADGAIATGQNLLLGLNVVSIGGAIVIAWVFVGALLRRLAQLSERMRGMAAGDLEAEVEMDGHDEVAEMAAALEVFRRRSLEAQRLNLVEKLAEELRGKNDELEKVLGDLRKAQDQIVMREKLAALGQLTAGVAHEIKNPLNFVKNFSEGCKEILEELQEEIPPAGEELKEEQRQLIVDIGKDLDENLTSIHQHGERANRIVHDMLSMGRGSGERQLTDINALLDEHARLGYHSARATDSNFQLNIKEDFDDQMGELSVVAQDMGRVFLNMVSNACYATDQRRATAQDGENGAGYEPTLWLATRRTPDTVEIRIRDNGGGIPPDVVDKIFNPFFTTKPTDQGTGLGLALSNDIVREHGGAIRVETEPGEFTEMIVELPVRPSAATAQGDDSAPDDAPDDEAVDQT